MPKYQRPHNHQHRHTRASRDSLQCRTLTRAREHRLPDTEKNENQSSTGPTTQKLKPQAQSFQIWTEEPEPPGHTLTLPPPGHIGKGGEHPDLPHVKALNAESTPAHHQLPSSRPQNTIERGPEQRLRLQNSPESTLLQSLPHIGTREGQTRSTRERKRSQILQRQSAIGGEPKRESLVRETFVRNVS